MASVTVQSWYNAIEQIVAAYQRERLCYCADETIDYHSFWHLNSNCHWREIIMEQKEINHYKIIDIMKGICILWV